MNSNVYSNGSFYISNKTIKLYGKTIILSNIETMKVAPCPRHSLFFGIKEWFYLFIILVIVCNIWRKIMWIGEIYIYTIFILIIYNIIMFCIKYYELVIQIGVEPVIIRSRDKEFLMRIQEKLEEEIESLDNNSYTVNIDNCTINNGIINNGNDNINNIGRK